MVARSERVESSSSRHSTASAPCATCGTNSDGENASAMWSASSNRSSAATAMTIAPPAGTFASRVWMLPRSSVNARSGRAWASCARRRTAPVATVAPGASSWSARPTRQSRGSPRSGTAAIVRPGVAVDGRSFAEWTAKSASPPSTAACTSFTKTPWPPSSWIGAVACAVAQGLDEHELDVEVRRKPPAATDRRRARLANGRGDLPASPPAASRAHRA